MTDRTIHLVCNAHLDPVWLWEWEEGAAAAISTFRTAADLGEKFDGFIFNHNEAILYRWVEEYEPALFVRIQRLVQQGKWHIMGGWYLQPDCNMPSGESFVRQILLGRNYFQEKFGVTPTTAINFDSFGHSRGLVQIMAKSGFDSYLICRPDQDTCKLPGNEFIWEGYDGSRVLVLRPSTMYNTPLGGAREKTELFIKSAPQSTSALMLWGVGNHGGGPSRKDLADLADLINSTVDLDIRHSTPEAYFAGLSARSDGLPVHRMDINPWAVGCYTSMIRVKQKHRQFENELYATEKMVVAAWSRGWMAYPIVELREAQYDLATCEFHDILPGSSIQPAEEMALRIIDHGLENLTRVKARAFFSLAKGQPAAIDDCIPILVYNPHPYPIQGVVECEFQLHDFNWEDIFTDATAYSGDQALPTQVEKEISNLNLDWRKRIAFTAELAPSQMNRFDCRLNRIPKKPTVQLQTRDGVINFQTDQLEVTINAQTGLVDAYRTRAAQADPWVDYLDKNAFCPLVMRDNPDSWGMLVRKFRDDLGGFNLLSPEENQRFSGVLNAALPSVRVIEDGAVRSVVEAVLGYGNSRIVLQYKLPKQGTEIEVVVRVHWNEKDRMLKLSLPSLDKASTYMGQVAYGCDTLAGNGSEQVAQKWVAIVSKSLGTALTIINDGTYGSDFCYGEARISLLRSPAYSGHPFLNRPILPQDRYLPRHDQGERLYHFWINGGPLDARLAVVDREALVHNERPMALSFFPDAGTLIPQAFITLDDQVMQITALKKVEDGDDLLIRLFNPTGQEQTTTVRLSDTSKQLAFGPFEIRTFRLNQQKSEWTEVNLIEQPI